MENICSPSIKGNLCVEGWLYLHWEELLWSEPTAFLAEGMKLVGARTWKLLWEFRFLMHFLEIRPVVQAPQPYVHIRVIHNYYSYNHFVPG